MLNDSFYQWAGFHTSQVPSKWMLRCQTPVFYCSISRDWWRFLPHNHCDLQTRTSDYLTLWPNESLSTELAYPVIIKCTTNITQEYNYGTIKFKWLCSWMAINKLLVIGIISKQLQTILQHWSTYKLQNCNSTGLTDSLCLNKVAYKSRTYLSNS